MFGIMWFKEACRVKLCLVVEAGKRFLAKVSFEILGNEVLFSAEVVGVIGFTSETIVDSISKANSFIVKSTDFMQKKKIESFKNEKNAQSLSK